jgi:hypothetical protein
MKACSRSLSITWIGCQNLSLYRSCLHTRRGHRVVLHRIFSLSANLFLPTLLCRLIGCMCIILAFSVVVVRFCLPKTGPCLLCRVACLLLIGCMDFSADQGILFAITYCCWINHQIFLVSCASLQLCVQDLMFVI